MTNTSRFSTRYELLKPSAPGWGEIAPLPWDEEVFGFGVGDFRVGDVEQLSLDPAKVVAALQVWAAAHAAKLVGCTIAAPDRDGKGILQLLGFGLVEPTLLVTSTSLGAAALAEESAVRRAEPIDADSILEIASTTFAYGRYHADARFPLALAHRRYRVWCERALESVSTDPAERMFVIGQRGHPSAFMHVRIVDGRADLRLAGVALRARGVGGLLWTGTLAALRAEGVREAYGRISAVNVPVLKLYAGLGFRFSDPRLVYHWYSALHLDAPSD